MILKINLLRISQSFEVLGKHPKMVIQRNYNLETARTLGSILILITSLKCIQKFIEILS